MADVLSPSRPQTLARRGLQSELKYLDDRPISSPFDSFTVDPATGEIVKAWWDTETITGDLLNYGKSGEFSAALTDDPDFNPYSYYQMNENEYADMQPFVHDGYFDGVNNEHHFQLKSQSIREEIEKRELIHGGNAWQYILGVGASLVDPSTLIPIFGWGQKGNVVRRGISVGLQTGGVMAAEEALHQRIQTARTIQESLMNIGVATTLGTGIGMLGARFANRRISSHQHPDNPLNSSNFSRDEAGSEWHPGMDMSPSEYLRHAAMADMKFDPNYGVTFKRTKFERAVDWTQSKIGWTRSPTTVAARTASGKARNLLDSLAEMGVHYEELGRGATRRVSVEMHKDVSVTTIQQVAEEGFTRAWYDMMAEFGHRSEAAVKFRSDLGEFVGAASNALGRVRKTADGPNLKGIPLPEFQYLVWKRLMGDMTPHANTIVEKGLKKAVGDRRRGYRHFTDMMFERAVRVGLLREDQRVGNYFPQIWDADKILSNGSQLIVKFKRKFKGRFETDEELEDFANDLVDKLSNRHDADIPDGFARSGSFSVVGKGRSNRMESRELQLNADELDEFSDFLITDVTRVMKQYADDMGGRIALRETFGEWKLDPKLKDKKEIEFQQSWEEMANPMKEIRQEFAELRAEARKKGESVEKLKRDEELVSTAVRNLRERVMNVDRRPSDDFFGTGALYAGRMARRVNYLRFMGSVMLASLTDVGTISLSHGAGKHLQELGRNFGKIAKEAKNMNNRELAFLMYGAEGVLSQQRTAKLVGIDDAIYQRGFGHGRVRRASGAIEAMMNWGSGHMNTLNMMHLWNSRHKFLSGHIVLGNILDDAAKLAKGTGESKYKWRELGLSDATMKRIDALTKKHGFDEQRAGTTFRWPDTEKWFDEPGGAKVVATLHAALKRNTDRAVITPGIADMPIFHSKEVGQLLFQFNSFGFAAINKFTRNLAYKATNGEMGAAAISMAWALGMGATAFAVREGIIKDRFRDGTMPEESGTWVYEAIDRSGLMMWTMPYANSMMKLFAPKLHDMGIPIEQPSRFAAQHWLQSMFGPTFGGLGGDVGDMVANTVEGDMEKVGTKAKRLIPFRNLFYITMLNELMWKDD